MVVNVSNWSAKNPYMSKITECYVLNGEGSRKETRHVVFDLGDSGLDYKVGDALGVLSENPENTVDNAYQDITMLSFWGTVVTEANTAGFAMEFIGDMKDSQATKVLDNNAQVVGPAAP